MRTLLLTLMALFAVSAHAQAPPLCPDTQTFNDCIDALISKGRGVAAPAAQQLAVAKASSEKAVAESQPGADAGAPQARSTVTDLIPWFNMLGLLSDSDASDGTIAVDLNFLLGKKKANADNNTQLKWVLDVSPEPFTPLIEAFPEAVRGARKSELGDRIGDTADSELQLSWSLVNDRFGRDLRRNYARMSALLGPAIESSIAAAGRKARLNYVLQLMALLPEDVADKLPESFDDTVTVGSLSAALEPAQKDKLQTALFQLAIAVGAEQKATAAAIAAQLSASGLDQLPKLVLQQPQLLFSATRRFRDELVGPDAWGAKITYEHSFANFGHFLRRNRNECKFRAAAGEGGGSATLDNSTLCYRALLKYLDDHKSDLDNKDRISVTAEYRQVDSLSLSFPTDGVVFDVPKTDRLIVGAGYGRVLSGGRPGDRVDFKVDYDSNIDDKANGKSRFVVSLTYLRRIAGLDVPFGLVYANKSEFLEGVDKQVSLHVGVKFRAPAKAD